MINVFSKTDIGRVRKVNQDAVKTEVISDNLAWSVVCDGMGGQAGGDIASNIAVIMISKFLSDNLSELKTSDEIKSVIYEAVSSANQAIYLKSEKDKNLKNMGTTVIVCVVSMNKLYVAHMGDSRAYLISDDEITQITTDHSMVQEMLDNGKLTIEEARNHPQKNIITRALGVNPEIKLEYNTLDIKKGNIILSCTDGLTNTVEEQDIYNICKKCDNKEEAVGKLISKGNKNGGNDNITVSLICC
ncbi:MAG: Stp1/IreP family PP2C-type Ser/Thr phosphatase [Clostridia bacterium]|nr:Stp1/IreP family PP2C-type Ser/Thr phosphatase [Clostridia bacterium]